MTTWFAPPPGGFITNYLINFYFMNDNLLDLLSWTINEINSNQIYFMSLIYSLRLHSVLNGKPLQLITPSQLTLTPASPNNISYPLN